MNITAPKSLPFGPTTIDRLLKFGETREILGLSKSTMYRMLERHELPRPVKIGALTYFSEREIQEWIAGKLASRGQEAGRA